MKNLWKRFERLTDRCYLDLAQGAEDMKSWNDGYTALLAVVAEGRRRDPDFAAELYLLDDDTDFHYDVQGWLEDYLDELDMRERYGELEKVCRELLETFRWEEESPEDIRYMLATAMKRQGRTEDTLDFCEKWYKKEPDSAAAAAALIRAKSDAGDCAGAEELVKRHIKEDTRCTEETDILYSAASALYRAAGNSRAAEKIDQEINQYEKELEKRFLGLSEALRETGGAG